MPTKDPKTGKFLASDTPVDEETADLKTAGPTLAEAMLAIAEALKTAKAEGDSPKLAAIEQFLLERERTRPQENLFNPPLISAYNPLGERDHPRPELQCKIVWVGYQLSKEACTREEIELLNQLKPGSYRVTKSDGRSIPFTVTATFNDAGKLDRLNVHYPCKNSDDRQNHLSMSAYLREALGLTPPEVQELHALQAQVVALKAELGLRAA